MSSDIQSRVPSPENKKPVRFQQQMELLYSPYAMEIISQRPGFLQKWALLIFLCLLILLFFGTWFIRYPDIVRSSAILTAENAPKEIMIRGSGKVLRILKKNGDSVRQGGDIAWIESTADHRQVYQLVTLLDSTIRLLTEDRTNEISYLFNANLPNLGEIQPQYQQFIAACHQFNDYLKNGYYYKKKISLVEDRLFLQKMHSSILQQISFAKRDIQLAEESSETIDSLYLQHASSKQEMRELKSRLIGKQVSLPQLEFSLLSNESGQNGKEKEIKELEHTIQLQKDIFQQATLTLRSVINEWRQRFVLSAAVAGKISYTIPFQENQFLQEGKLVGYINPPDSRYYGEIILKQENFGKISVGQKIRLRFDAYPYQEFGEIEGQLSYISSTPSDSGFLATVMLPNGLKTTYNKTLQYRNGLRSQALIITRDVRLIERFVNLIRKNAQP